MVFSIRSGSTLNAPACATVSLTIALSPTSSAATPVSVNADKSTVTGSASGSELTTCSTVDSSPVRPEIKLTVCSEIVTTDAEPVSATTTTLPKPKVTAGVPPGSSVNVPLVKKGIVGSVTVKRTLSSPASVTKDTSINPAPTARSTASCTSSAVAVAPAINPKVAVYGLSL